MHRAAGFCCDIQDSASAPCAKWGTCVMVSTRGQSGLCPPLSSSSASLWYWSLLSVPYEQPQDQVLCWGCSPCILRFYPSSSAFPCVPHPREMRNISVSKLVLKACAVFQRVFEPCSLLPCTRAVAYAPSQWQQIMRWRCGRANLAPSSPWGALLSRRGCLVSKSNSNNLKKQL